jgi:hypothetical protein
MTKKRCRDAALFATVLVLWSCAGDGTGLDEFGNPIRANTLELGPTLSSIQHYIFTPICTQCHTGAAAPLGLVLDSGLAQQSLVGVTSIGVPGLLLVNPGNPDSSYIVWKMEGRSGVQGGRMPLGMQPLSAEQITAIRGWIAGGALKN